MGRMLGGSSAMNGVMYYRGQALDYEDWVEAGARGWAWNEMARVFRSKDHVLPSEHAGHGAR